MATSPQGPMSNTLNAYLSHWCTYLLTECSSQTSIFFTCKIYVFNLICCLNIALITHLHAADVHIVKRLPDFSAPTHPTISKNMILMRRAINKYLHDLKIHNFCFVSFS